MIPGKTINILSANFNNKFEMFLSCCFIHPFIPGSGVGSGFGVGVGFGVGARVGSGGVGGVGFKADLAAQRILFTIIPIAITILVSQYKTICPGIFKPIT